MNMIYSPAITSPIDIRAADVDYALLHRMHFIHYDNIGPIHIVNNGHTVKADGFDRWGSRQPYIMGGGLKHRYNLIQFHIHWGQHDSHGSEHMISGLHYPAEIHLVHMRHDVTPAEALRKSDGVAVIGVFVVIGNDGSPMSTFSPLLENILHPGMKKSLYFFMITQPFLLWFSGNRTDVESFRTRSLLPSHTDAFYRYRGSLTTPECDEVVIWTVFSEPISITRSQVEICFL
ncbi:carbonate dehydratase, eukaryotic-type [Dictyocaulus viviparus]|uniref:Carbonic anhydrase n=1 Tax=Dictyocaulus viviparus TaxID=29172 RepID=A0A0D8XQR7_DICVI|nr:carbonate dehydratase, eukaryotic-type [Dictyocaulus viviparus]